MANGWNHGREDDYEVYTASQVESVLDYCEVEITSENSTHFVGYCPFHGNTESPAFEVDKNAGLYHCFNPSCGNSGTLEDLLRKTKGLNPFQALRIIIKYRNTDVTPLEERLREVMAKPVEFVKFDQALLDRMYSDFKGSPGETYMHSRHFTDDTLDYFRIGYSAKKNMVIVPMHDPKGMPVGLIGRVASEEKVFKNSWNLPKSKTTWNFHRAKKHGERIIVCEAAYDAMRIHQAGYPNVVALLGGHITSYHVAQLNKHFSRIVIMTDFDHLQYRVDCRPCQGKCKGHRPGRDLGRSIAERLSNKRVMWATYDDTCVYPHGAKDSGDMTDVEIRQCLRNAIPNIEYVNWNIEVA